MNINKKNRLVLIDLLKIVFAIFVFLRHSATMGGCQYTLFTMDALVRICNDMMSFFFIASGFCLYYSYCHKNLTDIKETITFYKKRAISILPIYFLVIILHFIFLERNIGLNLGLLPIEITGTHTFFNGTFSLLHNRTTWFVSCIILSYFIYPLIQELVKYLKKKYRFILFSILLMFLTYSFFMIKKYGIGDPYSNPLFRGLEFALGVLLCSIVKFSDNKSKNWLNLVLFIGLLISNIVVNKYNLGIAPYIKYLTITLLIYFGSKYVSSENWITKVIGVVAIWAYPFYILQNFIWEKSEWINGKIMKISDNTWRILSFFGILLAMTLAVTYLYQKPISKYFKRKLLDSKK